MIERSYTRIVNSDRLSSEILANGIPLEGITLRDGEPLISLDDSCTTAQLDLLDTIVVNHVNKPAPLPLTNGIIWQKETTPITTTSKNAISAHSWDIAEIPIGWYKVSWVCSYTLSDKNKVGNIGVAFDNNDIFSMDVGKAYAKGGILSLSGFDIVELPVIAAHNISLKFNVKKKGSITIYNSTLTLENLQS